MEQLNSSRIDEGLILDEGEQATQPEPSLTLPFEAKGSALSRLPHRIVERQVFVSIPIRPRVKRSIKP